MARRRDVAPRAAPPVSADEELRLRVRVKPRASKSRVLGTKEGELEVAVAAPPVDDAANQELVRTLAEHFDVPKSAVQIVLGQHARSKVVRVTRPRAPRPR